MAPHTSNSFRDDEPVREQVCAQRNVSYFGEDLADFPRHSEHFIRTGCKISSSYSRI
jgi:hypothetical protein